MVTTAATGSLVLTALALRGRRMPVRLLITSESRPSIGQAATGWAQRKDLSLVGALLVGDESDGAEANLDYETFGLPTGSGVDDLAERVTRLRADAVVVLPSPGIDGSVLRRIELGARGDRTNLAIKTELQNVSRRTGGRAPRSPTSPSPRLRRAGPSLHVRAA